MRLLWGALKNLLGGVTTVSHHNPYEPDVFDSSFPVCPVKRYGWAHSLHFSPDARTRYGETPPQWPFLIHAGEGTDDLARSEIHQLSVQRLLSERTVLIHAVALNPSGIQVLRQHRTAIVWCPTSNDFTLGRTLSAEVLRGGLPVALGTDSGMTGQGDMIDELCFARTLGHATPEELFDMVTRNAARILRLKNGEGSISECGVGDLVAVEDQQQTPAAALIGFRPELVIQGGKIRLVSRRFASRLPPEEKAALQEIHVEGRGEYLVRAKVAELYSETSEILGPDIRLAGRKVRV